MRHQPWQKVGREGGENAQAKVARHGVARGACHLADMFGLGQGAAGACGNLHADGSEHDMFIRALEKLHAQCVFQFFQLHGKGGLADMAGQRGFAKMQMLRHGDEIL